MAVILIVDDEPVVVRAVRAMLQQAGHSVYHARSGAEADLLAAGMASLDLLIANHRIAMNTGREIAERLLLTHPEAKVMHISGYPREFMEEEGTLTPGAAYLGKPFRSDQMNERVRSLLAQTPPASFGFKA